MEQGSSKIATILYCLIIVFTGSIFTGCDTEKREVIDYAGYQCIFAYQVAIQPSFTSYKKTDDGGLIEVYVELTDSFGDPLKALGVFRFELFRFQPAEPDSRGARLALGDDQMIEFERKTLQANQSDWDYTTRNYRFKLNLNQAAAAHKKMVLQVTFTDTANNRLEDHITVER